MTIMPQTTPLSNLASVGKKVLVTGFEPFDHHKVNVSFEAVKRLPWEVDGARLIKLEVPSLFNESIAAVTETIDREHPDVVILVGLAGGRSTIAVERVAININDARIPDNKGRQPIDTPVIPDDAPAYFSTLPIKAVVSEIARHGIPVEVSNTAGTYICNHLMFGVLSHILQQGLDTRCGFIHVPLVEPSKGVPLEVIVAALEHAVRTSLTTPDDIGLSGGKEF